MSALQAERTRASRTRIMKVAAQLFAQHGYHAVSMSELCESLAMSRGGFYHHFSGKEDLLEEICRHYMSELLEKARLTALDEPDAIRRIERLGTELVVVITENLAELTVCFRDNHSLSEDRRKGVLALHAEYSRIWKRAIEDGAQQGTLMPYSRVRLKAILGMYFYSYVWIKAKNAAEVKEATEVFNTLTLTGLRAVK